MTTTFVKLVVGENRAGQASVVTQTETAAFFGWDKEFPEWKRRMKSPDEYGGWLPFEPLTADWRFRGGHRLRICRSKRKTGYPQGLTHCFRMQGCWSRKHLVELAYVAGDKFEWMENKSRRRVDRDVWLSLA